MKNTEKIRIPVIILIFACAAAVIAAAALLSGCSLLFPPVFTSVKVGETNAMAIDDDGTIHLVYSFNTETERWGNVSYVYYASGTPGGTWTEEMIHDGEGLAVYADAIGIDPDGVVHVIYRERKVACHAWRSSAGVWSSETFISEEAGPVGGIAFDSAGGIHVVHSGYKTDTLLLDNLRPFYSYKGPGDSSFTTTVIDYPDGWTDVNYGRKSSIAVDSAGKAHMVFGREANILVLTAAKLYYASAEASGGTVNDAVVIAENVTDNVDNAIAIDVDGTIHVAYLGYSSSTEMFRYLSFDGTTWSGTTAIDTTAYAGNGPDLGVDSSGGLHAGYLVASDGTTISEVKYAYRESSSSAWDLEEVDTDGNGLVSLVLDDDDSPVLLYAHDTGEDDISGYLDLVLAYKDGTGSWITQTIRDTSIPE